ncbi:hypothetical protein CDCA_CDCA10G2981 [Cyanidium caldarium]|uniref:Uncharacterized protein n=1 Tax=Cyanidium caldarium TaxID=2771 RepID=A0AAV9IXV4_CYACA|nr:hypothetical protein CDCA_CDCA10G2981 [Cyanidium caldarium]
MQPVKRVNEQESSPSPSLAVSSEPRNANSGYLSGYAARPRNDWSGEAVAVTLSSAAFVGSAYLSWEAAARVGDGWLRRVAHRFAASAASGSSSLAVALARHPGTRLTLFTPIALTVASFISGGTRGAVGALTTQSRPETPRRVLRPEWLYAVGLLGGTGIGAALYRPLRQWRSTFTTSAGVLAPAVVLGGIGGIALSGLLAIDVWAFAATERAAGVASQNLTRRSDRHE